jgi:hypothetical protein
MEQLENEIKQVVQEIKQLEIKKAELELDFLKLLYNSNKNNNDIDKIQKERVGTL